MVLHNSAAELRSKSGGGGGPLAGIRFERDFGLDFESRDVLESLASEESFRRSSVVDGRGEAEGRLMFGRTNLFCLLGGRISSKSTGTPSETRNKRRIRDRVQLGGCIGGGETSCCHSESDRSDRNGEVLDGSMGGISFGDVSGTELGNMALMYGVMASCR